jgi:hypothetical protein
MMSTSPVPGFDQEALRRACHKLADQLLFSTAPQSDIAQHVDLAEAILMRALHHVEFLVKEQLDPNLLTMATVYISNHHAMPKSDRQDAVVWFSTVLEVFVELMCPNTPGSPEEVLLYGALEEGLEVLREDAGAAKPQPTPS